MIFKMYIKFRSRNTYAYWFSHWSKTTYTRKTLWRSSFEQLIRGKRCDVRLIRGKRCDFCLLRQSSWYFYFCYCNWGLVKQGGLIDLNAFRNFINIPSNIWCKTFAKLVNCVQLLAIFAKSFIIDLWQGPEYACGIYLHKKKLFLSHSHRVKNWCFVEFLEVSF